MYHLTEGSYCCENTVYTGYGIANEQIAIEDVTCDKGAMEKLVVLCNRTSLSSAHLMDVVQDFLGAIEEV